MSPEASGDLPPAGVAATRRGDPGYERARTGAVFNARTPDRFPELIARPASEREIPELLAYARESGLRVAIRSGGHHWSGPVLRDGALLLDLSRLRHCHVDPGSSTATVGPAVTGGRLAARLAPHRLAFPTGHCPDVALGGYLLSGGMGWNCRESGPACRYVEEIRAVTADGRTVTCSERENPDLFWAARGAGPGFFAVVTRFRLRLLPQPGSIMTASLTFPLADAERVGGWALRTARESPPNVETSLVLTPHGPAAGGVAAGPRLKVESSVFAGTPEEAAAALAPVDACPFTGRAVDHRPARPTSFRSLYGATDSDPDSAPGPGAGSGPGADPAPGPGPGAAPGSGPDSAPGPRSALPAEHRYAVDTLWSPEPYETQLARSARQIAKAPSTKSHVLIAFEPVAPDPVALRHMAFSVLGESYVAPFAVWDDPEADAANIRWLHETMDALDPDGTGGHYIAEADLAAGEPRFRGSYGPADWARLKRLREQWDPSGLFHTDPAP
ncbi:FAD-binding oxidoreductase [Streptomyces sp. HNM0575]|uniref:FAD-binding oxidoreductase n=1 Tax=Streptomyces sp. HNM0575 TaxID=2716338 RepID=UPI003216B1A6